MSADRVLEIVEDLTDEGTAGFRASAVARRLSSRVEQVTLALLGMVRDGRLRLRFDVICPDNGRTIESFWQEQELPIGQTRRSDRCDSDEPFVVDKAHIWITFVPSERFRLGVRRRRAQCSRETRVRAGDEQEPGLARRTGCRPTWGGETSPSAQAPRSWW